MWSLNPESIPIDDDDQMMEYWNPKLNLLCCEILVSMTIFRSFFFISFSREDGKKTKIEIHYKNRMEESQAQNNALFKYFTLWK